MIYMANSDLRKRKGVEFSIRTIAMITLGIMVVSLIYVSFDTWFTELVNSFLGEVEFGTVSEP